MQTSVNRPLKLDDAERVTRIKRVRVEMHVKEDKAVRDDQVYQKDIDMRQIVDDGSSATNTTSESPAHSSDEQDSPNDASDDYKVWNKNIIDNILARLDNADTRNVVLAVIGILLGAFALGLVVLR